MTKIRRSILAAFIGELENQDYGNQDILNEYAGVRPGTRIPGRLQHGWNKLVPASSYYRNNNLDTFVWSLDAQEWARKQNWENFTAIGAPWLYLLEILEGRGWGTNLGSVSLRKIDELWVYGRHSAFETDELGDDLFEFLEQVGKSNSQRKLVLLSWFDYANYSKSNFVNSASLQVVTLGPRRHASSANSHLYQLYHLLAQTKKIVLDYPTTLLFYGITLGCDIKWLRNESFTVAHARAMSAGNHELVHFMQQPEIEGSTNLEFALNNLGKESLKSPEQLRDLFGWGTQSRKKLTSLMRGIKTLLFLPSRYMSSTKIDFLKTEF